MTQVEAGEFQNPGPRLILVDGEVATEFKAGNNAGVKFLSSVRANLEAAIEGGLVAAEPYILDQPEKTPPADKESVEIPKTAASWTSSGKRLELATSAWLANLASATLMNEFYGAYWDLSGIRMGLSVRDRAVNQAPFSDEEIYRFMKLENFEENLQQGNPGVDLPYFHLPVLASQKEEARLLISRGFANLGASWVFQSGYEIKNGHETSGWMRVDASRDAPYRLNQNGELTGLNVVELKAAIAADNRTGQTANIYGPSGNIIKVVFDYYPDQVSTSSRLPESVRDGWVLDAGFNPGGYFNAGSLWSRKYRYPRMGGRSFLGA